MNRPRTPCMDCGSAPKRPGRGERYCETCATKLHVPGVDADTQLAIVRAYARPGATLDDVAAAFYVSAGTARRVLLAHDVPIRPRGGQGTRRLRLAVDDELERARLYGQGLSIKQVADVVGRSPSAVHATLHRLGVTMRPQGVNLRPQRRHARRHADGRYATKEAA